MRAHQSLDKFPGLENHSCMASDGEVFKSFLLEAGGRGIRFIVLRSGIHAQLLVLFLMNGTSSLVSSVMHFDKIIRDCAHMSNDQALMLCEITVHILALIQHPVSILILT